MVFCYFVLIFVLIWSYDAYARGRATGLNYTSHTNKLITLSVCQSVGTINLCFILIQLDNFPSLWKFMNNLSFFQNVAVLASRVLVTIIK